MAPDDGADPADLLRHADTALYKAKAAGRNTLIFFNPAMAEEMLDRHEIEVDLRKACDGGRARAVLPADHRPEDAGDRHRARR